MVLARPPQARVEAVAARTRGRLVGAAARVVVDRRPVRDRLDVLLRRPVPRLRAARRLGRRRDGLLRRLDLLHVGRRAPVAGDDQRGPRPRSPRAERLRVLTFEPRRIDWWSSGVQLVGTVYFNFTTFHALQAGLDAGGVRPPRVEARRARLGLLPRLGLPRVRRGLRPPLLDARSHASSGRSPRSTSSAASRSASRRSPRSGCLDSGGVLALAASNWFTALGGLCFLVGAVLLLPESAATEAVESGGAALYAHP